MSGKQSVCPHCGACLPAEASFCPHCARMIRARQTVDIPSHLWRKDLKCVAGAENHTALGVGKYLCITTRTNDAYGDVTYTDADGTYQLLLTFQNERFTPQPEITEQAELDGEYRMPSRLFINHVGTGANAGMMVMQ